MVIMAAPSMRIKAAQSAGVVWSEQAQVARNRWKIGRRDQTAPELQPPSCCATAKVGPYKPRCPRQHEATSSRPFSSRSATERPPDLKFLLYPKQAVAFCSTATEILYGSANRGSAW